MGRVALVGLFGGALALFGCGDGGGLEVQATLTLLAEPACRPPPGRVESLRVDALGDFPPSDARTVEVIPIAAGEPSAIDRFPAETQLLRFSPEGWDAAGFLARPSFGLGAEVLLLPFGARCPLDEVASMRFPVEAAIAVADDGTVVVAGGREGGMTSRAVRILGPNARAGEEIASGLVQRREGASATAIGDLVVVAGGGIDAVGSALDTFELVDVAARAVRPGGRLVSARRDHGAARLLDGRVLLVGGIDAANGNVLASAEALDPATGESLPMGDLPWARRAPEVLALDDGAVVVLGGYGTGGNPTVDAAIFDPIAETFVVQAGVSVPQLARFDAVALPGGRAAFFGDYDDGSPPVPPEDYPRVRTFRRVPPFDVPGAVAGVPPEALGFDAAELTILEDLRDKRGAVLPNGSFFLAGLFAGAEPRAYFVDLAHGRLTRAPATSVPTAVVARPDGTIVELDAAGAVLRREDVPTELDNPPATLLVDELAFDAPGHWQTDGLPADTFRAITPNARVDLASYRFASVRIDALEVEGVADLLLVGDGRPPIEVHVLPGEVGPGVCTLPRVAGDPVSIERRGDSVVVEIGAERIECVVEGLTDRIGIAIVAAPGTTIRQLRVRRLAE